MDIIQGIKRRQTLGIIIVIIAFVIVGFTLLMLGGSQSPEKNRDMEGTENMTLEQLPENLKEEIRYIKMHYRGFGISKWEFDSKNNQVIIYAFNIISENKVNDLQGKQISNWTIKVVHDVSYEKKYNLIWAELMELENDPELQIAGFDMDTEEINIWVLNRTPKNEELDGKEIHGSTIHIWVSPTPPQTVVKK